MSYIEGATGYQRGRLVQFFPDDYVVIDTETTGLSAEYCEIIELSALRVVDNCVVDTFSSLVKPKERISQFITDLTGISNEMVSDAQCIEDVLPDFLNFIGDDIIIGHNITFDINFIRKPCEEYLHCYFSNDYVNTLRVARKFLRDVPNFKLSTLATHFQISQENAHRALDDCYTTFELYKKLKIIDSEYELKAIGELKNSEALLGKTLIFKGIPEIYSKNTYGQLCSMAGGSIGDMFLQHQTDYLVICGISWDKYMRKEYAEYMIKAVRLQNEGKLEILSEAMYLELLGIPVPEIPKIKKKSTKRYQSKIDIKSMQAERDDFDETHPLYDMTCVFTGKLDKMGRKEAMQNVLNFGGHIANTVTKATNFLILGATDYKNGISTKKTSKWLKAERYQLEGQDIRIIDETIFYQMLEE